MSELSPAAAMLDLNYTYEFSKILARVISAEITAHGMTPVEVNQRMGLGQKQQRMLRVGSGAMVRIESLLQAFSRITCEVHLDYRGSGSEWTARIEHTFHDERGVRRVSAPVSAEQ